MGRFTTRALLMLSVSVSAGLGCERKAPGPTECQKLALRSVGVADERWLEVPKVRAAVDDETVKCLTTPYDRVLVRCVEEQGNTRACYADFRRRTSTSEKERGSTDDPL